MLNLRDVDRVVDKAASAALKKARVSRVYSALTADSDGRDALLLTIVVRGGNNDDISGDRALDTIVRIRHDLLESGEERFPIIEFATEAELEFDASSQS